VQASDYRKKKRKKKKLRRKKMAGKKDSSPPINGRVILTCMFQTLMVPSELPLHTTPASGRDVSEVMFNLGLSVTIFLIFPSSGCFSFFNSLPD